MTTSPVLSITDDLLDELGNTLTEHIELNTGNYGHDDVCRLNSLAIGACEALERADLHIRSLTDRLEKAEKDALRLDWMISNKATVQRYPHKGRPTFGVHRIEVGKYQRTEHDSPREAIDAAIAQEADHE